MTNFGVRTNRGFSLIELSMVLAVTAVMAAIAIPVLSSSMRDMQLLSDARKIASTMSYAKMSSTAQMTSYQLAFDIEGNNWSLLKKRSATSTEYDLQQAVNPLSDGVADSGITFRDSCPVGTAPAGFENVSSATSVIFNSRGIPNGAAIIYLSGESTHFAVSVSLAGKVQVWRYRENAWAPV